MPPCDNTSPGNGSGQINLNFLGSAQSHMALNQITGSLQVMRTARPIAELTSCFACTIPVLSCCKKFLVREIKGCSKVRLTSLVSTFQLIGTNISTEHQECLGMQGVKSIGIHALVSLLWRC